MAVTVSEFKTRFPEFASVSDDRIELFLGDAGLILNAKYWGNKYDLCVNYYTAHALSLAIESENSISTNDVLSKSSEFSGEKYYMQTTYGQRYLHLLDCCNLSKSRW